MEVTRLGVSGLKVSRIALGCMSFGDATRGGVNAWTLDDAAAEPIFRQAVELGITFWDTANVYGYGTSVQIVGRAIRTYARRADIVLATKVHLKMHDGPGGSGLSRKAVMAQIDASLTRLGTDYVDLYQIHRFDPDTPVEETMETLHDVVKAGKARYLGASSMWAWRFAKMQYVAASHGWTRFVSMQNQYNLMQREEEREMFGLLADQRVASIPWGPVAKGRLSRPFGEESKRSEHDSVGRRFIGQGDRPIIEAVGTVAVARGMPMAQVALAWVLTNPVVAAPCACRKRHPPCSGGSVALSDRQDRRPQVLLPRSTTSSDARFANRDKGELLVRRRPDEGPPERRAERVGGRLAALIDWSGLMQQCRSGSVPGIMNLEKSTVYRSRTRCGPVSCRSFALVRLRGGTR